MRLGREGKHAVYNCPTWSGDSGAALVMFSGHVVGMHLDGVNALRERFEHDVDDLMDAAGEAAVLTRRVEALELSVKSAVESTASGAVALLCSAVLPKLQEVRSQP